MIKAIVFDLGGVLFDLDTDACIRAFREGLGYEKIVEILDKIVGVALRERYLLNSFNILGDHR